MKKKKIDFNLVYPALVVVFLLFQLLFLTKAPSIMEDEPWYASTAYSFALGNWFTNTSSGHFGGDFFVMYTFLLGIGMKMFGCSLFLSRFVSVAGGVIALWGLINILRYLKISKFASVLVLLMFIFSNVIYVIFRTTRPDGWILTFGIWAVYYLIKYISEDRNRDVVLASVFGAFSFIVHPNGILFLLSAGIYLLVNSIKKRKITSLLYFCIAPLLIILTHFTIVFTHPGFSFKYFFFQLSVRNSLSDNNFSLAQNIMNFFEVYTLGIKRLFILIFELGVLIAGLFFLKKNKIIFFMSLFGLLNLVFSLILFSNYDSRHFGEIIVFSLVAFSLMANLIENIKLRQAILLLGAVYLMNNLAGDAYMIYIKHKDTPYRIIEKQLAGIVPDKSVVITSLHFWYPFRNCDFYNEYTYWDSKPVKNLDDLLAKNDPYFVVITPYLVSGKTETSGRKEEVPENILEFYRKNTEKVKERGRLVKEVPTVGFDTLKIYKMNAYHP